MLENQQQNQLKNEQQIKDVLQQQSNQQQNQTNEQQQNYLIEFIEILSNIFFLNEIWRIFGLMLFKWLQDILS